MQRGWTFWVRKGRLCRESGSQETGTEVEGAQGVEEDRCFRVSQ